MEVFIFSVPFTNHLGRFLCVFTMHMAFALYLSRKIPERTPAILSTLQFWLHTVCIDLTRPLSFLIKGAVLNQVQED